MIHLQKDVEIALSWFSVISEDRKYANDVDVFKYLEWYMRYELN